MQWVVASDESGVKLLTFLSQHIGDQHSTKSLKRAIEKNRCIVNGRVERFASTMLGRGDRVSIDLDSCSKTPVQKEEPSRIIFEDEGILVYDKPAGVVCDEKGIIALLKGTRPCLQLVHRLDRETSGVIVLAKNIKPYDALIDQFKRMEIHKRYMTIVDGAVLLSEGVIKNFLGKKKAYAGQTIWGSVDSSQGLTAITEWKCLKRGDSSSLITCFPRTGRTHQIRVHMAEMGHPILGDFQYGKRFRCTYRPDRILLHAQEIRFVNPSTDRSMICSSSVPSDMVAAQQTLFGN